MKPASDRFAGCLLGLAMGDALGAPYEGGPVERLLWRVIGRTRDGCMRWTDDTQMSVDLAESLLESDGLKMDALARRFADGYRWSRGYGPGTARVLKRIKRGEAWTSAVKATHPGGSYGNGAAMRAPVLALFFFDDRDSLLQAAEASARITHGHPLAIDGAALIASACYDLLHDAPPTDVVNAARAVCRTKELGERVDAVESFLRDRGLADPREIGKALGSGTAALDSCGTALYIALRFLREPFLEMLQFIRSCGGDVDTVGAMAGALWGAANGDSQLPQVKIEARERLEGLALRLFERA